jgi:hypothetical protein
VSESANCPWTRPSGLDWVYVFDDSGLRWDAPGIRSLVQSGTKQISLSDDHTPQVGGSRIVLTGTEVEISFSKDFNRASQLGAAII